MEMLTEEGAGELRIAV